MHKFGIKHPMTVEDLHSLDKDSNHKNRIKDINKEMDIVQVASNFKEEGQCVPIGYQEITCQMIFDIALGLAHRSTSTMTATCACIANHCRNMSGHTQMGRPAAILETMVLLISLYVVVMLYTKDDEFPCIG